MIVCPLKSEQKIPHSVSLTSNRCERASNLLKVINNQPVENRREMFGVCSKQLNFENRNFGINFIEWVHLLRIFGAHRIHLYKEKLHKDVESVVDYLQENNFIEINSFEAPSDLKGTSFHTTQRRVLEINLLHDCLYRVKNLYEYVVVIDTDEVIIPMIEGHENWTDLIIYLESSKKGGRDYYAAKYVGYLPYNESLTSNLESIPNFSQFLRRTYVKFSIFSRLFTHISFFSARPQFTSVPSTFINQSTEHRKLKEFSITLVLDVTTNTAGFTKFRWKQPRLVTIETN